MKKYLSILLLLIPILSFSQTKIKINQQETVELFPHTIDAGAGTEGSPYTHADSTAGIQTEISALSAGRGGGIILSTSRFNITKSTGIVIDTTSIKIQGVVSGFNKDVDALNQGTKGTSLIVSGNKGIVIKGVDATHRTGGAILNRLYLFGTTTLQSVGSSTGTIGINLQSYLDQPNLENINIGGFDYGIKLTNSVGAYIDLAYYDKINILGGRIGFFADTGTSVYQKIVHSTFADQSEQNMYVSLSSANLYWEINSSSFVRGSGASGVTNPCNLYFGGRFSKITNCSFVNPGYNFPSGGPQRTADGLILAGNYNTVTNCVFTDCIGTSSAGIRITGNNNIVDACQFFHNTKDVIITGNNNTVFLPSSATYTDSGTGNSVITSATLGTFTSGSIPYAASGGSLTQNNTKLFWDNTNTRLGVGTSSPSATGTFVGANDISSVPQLSVKTATGGLYGTAFDVDATALAGGRTYRLFSSAGTAGEGQGYFAINDRSTGLDRILISPSGNFGIAVGTTTPGELLTLGKAGTTAGVVSLAGGTSGKIIIQTQAAAGTYNFNLPITAGTTGQVLQSGGGSSAAMTWADAPIIQAKADLTAQSSAGNITTFTVGSSTATFSISAYVNVTAIATDIIQGQITYTDENSTSQTVSLSTISAIGNSTYSPIIIRAKNATVITVKTNLSIGGGTVTFDAGARITQL